jgi:integrase
MAATLTERSLRFLRPGNKRSQALHDAAGSLQARMDSTGAIWFYYRDRSGGDDALKLGKHGAGGMTLREAFARARVHAGRPAEVRQADGTFEDLLATYVAKLQHAGKVSAADVARSFKRAIPEHDPLRRKRASAITAHDVTAIIARRLQAGRTEAARLRAHLHAAFRFGMHSDHNPEEQARDGAIAFGIVANPVAPVAPINERPNGNGQPIESRVLTWKELGAYWRALESEPEAVRSTLRAVLALGGQRIRQVLRAQWSDIEERNREIGVGVLRILDTKGRGTPRKHALPILPLAQAQLDPSRETPFFLDFYELSKAISRASKKVCRELGGAPFDQRALRRSVETRLGDLGVSKETRAHLLSHGRVGIQNRYDFAERLEEKRDALALLERHLRKAIVKRR